MLLAQGAAFTYQGRLNDGAAPANGSYDLTFSLFNTNTTGIPLAGPVTNAAVAVSNGLFTVMIDFGSSVWNGQTNWLEIGVRTNGASSFTVLAPRQQVTPTPYAITAGNVSGVIPSGNISGTYGNPVTFNNAGNMFSGVGSNLTALNASQLTFGTVADARLSANVALLNGNQTFGGANIFTNFGNSFRGSFFGNGLVGWLPTNGTAVQAVSDTGYLLTNSELVTVTLPASPSVDDIVRISGAGAGGWLVKENSGQAIFGSLATYRNSYQVEQPASGDYHDVAASADDTLMYLVGNGIQGVWASSDSGHTWNQAGPLSAFCQSVACSANGKIVYAVSTAGAIQMSTNGGAFWSSVSGSATTISCTADGTTIFTGNIACSGNGTYRATFTSSSISVSTNAGSSWFSVSVPSANLSCLAVSGDCTRLVTGVNNGLLYASANLGATWTPITTSNQFWSGAWMSRDGSKFAATVSNNGSTVGGVYNYGVSVLPNTISTNSTISGSQGTAVELQFIGNNQWMPVSSAGTVWAN